MIPFFAKIASFILGWTKLVLWVRISNTKIPALEYDGMREPKFSNQFSPKWAQFRVSSRDSQQMKNLISCLRLHCIAFKFYDENYYFCVLKSQAVKHLVEKALENEIVWINFLVVVHWGHRRSKKNPFEQLKGMKLTAIFEYKCTQF